MGSRDVSRCLAFWCLAAVAGSVLAFHELKETVDWSDSGTVPLQLLLESVRNKAALPQTHDGWLDSLVPWYSRGSRAEDDTAAREELQVSSVVKDDSFSYGAGVKKWHSLVVGSTTYLVGLGPPHLVVLTAKFAAPDVGSGQVYSLSERAIDVGGTPLAADLFRRWNSARKELEAIVVLYIEGGRNLLWFRISTSGLLEEIDRSWTVQRRVNFLKVFEVQEQMKLLILYSCETLLELVPCRASADVLDVNLGSPFGFRQTQILPLDAEAVSAEIGVVSDEVYLVLSLPNANVVQLFHFEWPLNSDLSCCGHFKSWRNFTSPRVTHALFFHVSYKLYLAIGGERPALFRFVSPVRIEGCPRALQNLGFVSTWLVLPIRTYRDEVVLLAEVEYVKSSIPYRGVVTLTWASVGVFHWQTQPRCFVGGVEAKSEGVSCILGKDSASALKGAVALQLGDAAVVSVLVPSENKISSLYRFNTRLEPVLNPLLGEILLLREAQAMLRDEISRQESEISETERWLQDTLNLDGPNIIRGEWVIQEVQTNEHEGEFPSSDVYPGSTQYVDVQDLKNLMLKLENSTRSLKEQLVDAAVPENGVIHLSGSWTLLGGLEVVKDSSFDSLYVNQMNGEEVSSLLKDAVRKDMMGKIEGVKTFTNLRVTDTIFTTINGAPKDDLVFNAPDQLVKVHGNVEFGHLLYVHGNVELPPLGTVGGIDLSEEIFLPGRDYQGVVQFDEVTVEGDLNVTVINNVTMTPASLVSIASGQEWNKNMAYDFLNVDGQLTVDKINGLNWDDIVKRIVWLDSSDSIDGITVVKGALSSQSIKIGHLNGLDFPGDFVFRKTARHYITGKKTIQDQLFVRSIDISNTVDGIPVKDLVTLNTNQILNGELKLKEADIYGDMKVDWAVNGIRLDNIYRRSPLIGDGVIVSSNVQLSHLVVDGPIQILSTLNDQKLRENILNILVLPSAMNGPVRVTGKKTVRGDVKVGGFGINVHSNVLNHKVISNIARYDNMQIFKGMTTIENVVFNEMVLTGRWDDVNVVLLNADALRLNGNQNTTTRLIFAEPSDLVLSKLVISGQINKFGADFGEYHNNELCDGNDAEGNCVLNRSIKTSVLRVAGSVHLPNGTVCGWNLHDFERQRLSRSRPQIIVGNLNFDKFEVKRHLDVSTFNNIAIYKIADAFPSVPFSNLDRLLQGGFAVDELYIDGRINTNYGVNSLNISKIADHAVRLHDSNTFLGSLVFEDLLSTGSLDVKGPVNNENLAYLVQDAVLKNDVSVNISGNKTFTNGFLVDGTIVTRNLNGIDPVKIISKDSPAVLSGPLRVQGNVAAGNVFVTGLLNNVPIENYRNRYKLVSEDHHVIYGNAHFLDGVLVDELHVNGYAQGLKLSEFFDSVVMKNEPARISASKIFINSVVFQNVTVRGLVNNLPLSTLVQDVVLHNDVTPAVIKGLVTFTSSLTSLGVSLSENLNATMLDGCLVKEWLDNAVYLGQSMPVTGIKTFSSISSNSDLKIETINALDLSKVITLHTPQDIPENVNMIAAAVMHNLKVNGLVNGKRLQKEYDNTLMTSGEQAVVGIKTFLDGITVQTNVQTSGYISGKEIANVVTLESEQTISGPLKFTNLVLEGNLSVSGGVSNIDLRDWEQRAFVTNSHHTQVVTGTWDVKGSINFMESIGGNGLLDGQNVHDLLQALHRSKENTRKTQEEVKADWTELCHDADALRKKAKAQPFLFQQLEVVQSIPSSKTISSMHAFEALNERFLAVSYANSCSGAMYRWNGQNTAWELQDGLIQNIGSVERWASIRNVDSTYLITSSYARNCSYQNGNIWKLEPTLKLENVHTMTSWHDAQIDEHTGQVHLLRQSGVDVYRLQNGKVLLGASWRLPKGDRSMFVPRSAGLGLAVTDGEMFNILEDSDNRTDSQIVSHTNQYLPAKSEGNLVSMIMGDGRKLIAVTVNASDMLVIYEDIISGHPLAKVKVHGAHSLSVLELTASERNGQTLLAFIENERNLRVVQYKGVEGFVDVTKSKLPFSIKEMVAIRLFARGLVNQRHFLLLRSDHQVLSVEVEMAGDPLDDIPLQCNLP